MQSLDRVAHRIDPLALRGVGADEELAEIGVEILSVCRFENLLRKISLPRQCRDCPESVALGAGTVAASSREDYGVAPPPEVEQHRLPSPPGGLTPSSDIFAKLYLARFGSEPLSARCD